MNRGVVVPIDHRRVHVKDPHVTIERDFVFVVPLREPHPQLGLQKRVER